MNKEPLYITAHQFCGSNAEIVKLSETCGCFYCCKIFFATEVHTFVTEAGTGKKVALCPYCMVDSLTPSGSGIEITVDLMKEMRKHWFWEDGSDDK